MTFDTPMGQSRLRFDGTINLATVISMVGIIISGVIWAGSLDSRLSSLETSFATRVESAQTREVDQESRLRTLELQMTRSDEKFNAILDRLQIIQQRVEAEP